jgi:hypothetical protein
MATEKAINIRKHLLKLVLMLLSLGRKIPQLAMQRARRKIQSCPALNKPHAS